MASALKQAKELAQYNNKLEQSNVTQQYEYNKALAEQDRDWQERMANSAHQREIADLKAAGLNPVLGITGGNGAATPSGSSASVSKANTDMSLPGKVMDMAIAQLNSATALQQAMIQAANGLAVAQTHAGATMYAADVGSATEVYKHDNTGGNTVIGQISNAPKILQRFLKNLNTGVKKVNVLGMNPSKASKDVKSLYNSYGKYIKEYERQKKNGRKMSKEETRYYNNYKRILKRVGYKVK